MRTIGAWLGLIGILAMLLAGFLIGPPLLFVVVWLPAFVESQRQRRRQARLMRNARRRAEPDKSWWAAQHRGKAPAE